jgi:REP element-mobilizing transposase RayT
MKNRDYRMFTSGSMVHVYNRGNNKEKIFLDDQDYKCFLLRLGIALGVEEKELNKNELTSLPYSRVRITSMDKGDFHLHAFCLMPNHFHLLIEQKGEAPISKLISRICTSYAKYLNLKYKRVGHVFQDQFKSVLIESNPQLMWVSAYIHMNPVKDSLVREPFLYQWSSYNDYIVGRNLPIIQTDFLISTFGNLNNFKNQTLLLGVKDAL